VCCGRAVISPDIVVAGVEFISRFAEISPAFAVAMQQYQYTSESTARRWLVVIH
jgi:hypothetical protein